MSRRTVPYGEVAQELESAGWALQRIWPPYRVFVKRGRLPILVRVERKQVDADDFAKIQEILRRDAETETDGP